MLLHTQHGGVWVLQRDPFYSGGAEAAERASLKHVLETTTTQLLTKHLTY